MDPLTVNLPIPKASVEQFAGLVAYAGELAANLFAAGGRALTLRAGHYARSQDPNTQQFVEDFVSGIDVQRNEILLQAICDCDPGRGMRDVNPFLTPLWSQSVGIEASLIGQVLQDKLAALPAHIPSDTHFSLDLYSDQPFYMIRKAVCNIFAVAMVRGAPSVDFLLCSGGQVTDDVIDTKVSKKKKLLPERIRDEKGNLKFHEAVDAAGQPVFDPVCDRAGRPMINPSTGEVLRQRRIEYETREVEREVDEVTSVPRKRVRDLLYLMVAKTPQIDQKDFLGASINESYYNPGWSLPDVFAGKCKDKQPFHGMEGT